jgi:hypothetical protein
MQDRIANLLLVAGPSGCGKSHFIDELKGGRTPTNIASRLPTVEGWQQSSVKRLSSGIDKLEAAAGLILHYDTMRPYAMKIEDYSDDHALMSLLSAASTLATILTIKIERDRLINQYRSRRSVFARLGLGKKLPLMAIYENGERLAEWSAKWDTFCAELQRRHSGLALIVVEPGDQDCAFGLAEPSPPSVNPRVIEKSTHTSSKDAHPPGFPPRGD